MIRYSLKCDHDHAFESWFASAEAFDRLLSSGMVACTVCGSAKVEKTLMAPAVRNARDDTPKPLTAPQSEVETALAQMRRAVEENSDYVGVNFVSEARAMHEGTAPERSIWGEAKLEDAKALADEGIAVTPLPFMPPRKTN